MKKKPKFCSETAQNKRESKRWYEVRMKALPGAAAQNMRYGATALTPHPIQCSRSLHWLLILALSPDPCIDSPRSFKI